MLLFDIVLPQVRGTLLVGLVLSFVTMLSVLSVPLMINPNSPTMITVDVAYRISTLGDYAVANALAEAEIASEIYSTAGDYDLLVKFYVDNETDIGHFINEKVQVLPGIQDTHTIITFKAFGQD